MRRLVVSFLIVTTIVLAALASSGGGSSRPHPAVLVAAPGPDRWAQLDRAQAVADYAHTLDAQRVGEYLHALAVDEVGRYLASIPPPLPEPVPTVAVEPVGAPVPATVASGARSYAWWEAIATCESGNTNAWRTGYYGLEGGPGVTYGGLSKSEQLAIAEDIYARAGDGAWGCAPVAWSNVPGG